MLKSVLSPVFQNLSQRFVRGENTSEMMSDIQDQMNVVSHDIQTQIALKKAEQDLRYTELGQNRESAMDWDEISKTVQIYNKLKHIYEEKFLTKGGTQAIINEYIDYLAQACQDPSTKTDIEKRQFNAHDPEDIRAYKSALRALLDDAPGSRFGSCLHPQAKPVYAMGKSILARDILAFYILAAMDDNMVLSPALEENRAQCVVEEILNLTSNIADIRRAHNAKGDFREADDVIDEPSCFPGVIGRIGNMHLHNPATGTDDIISPSEHFKRKAQAFFINEFKELAASDQFNIINGIYYKIYMFEEDADNPTLQNFIKSLFTDKKLQSFIKELEYEFGELDDDHLKMATLTFSRELLQSSSQIEQNLLQRLEDIANNNLVEAVKVSIEDELANECEVNDSIVQFRGIFSDFVTLRETLTTFAKDKPQDLKSLSLVEEQWEITKAKTVDLLKKHEATAQIIKASANSKLSSALKQFEDIYQKNRGKHVDILNEKKKGDIEFYPFWYLKIRLKFEDIESSCELEALKISKFLTTTKIEMLLVELEKYMKQFIRLNPKDLASQSPEQLVGLLLSEFDEYLLSQKINALTLDEKNTILNLLTNFTLKEKAHLRLPAELANLKNKLMIQSPRQPHSVPLASTQPQETVASSIQKRKQHLIALETYRLDKMPNLLGEFEIQKAQHYMMTQADTTEKLGLKGFLIPGVVVRIEKANTDPATVSFTNPFESKWVSKKKCKIPIATLKEYAELDRRLRVELAHEVDILLRKFSDLTSLPENESSAFIYLFLDQLSKYQDSDPVFYQTVIQNQGTNDLNALLDLIDTYPEGHAYKHMIEAMETSLSILSNESEYNYQNGSRALFTQRNLEEEIQKIYLRKKKVPLGNKSTVI